MSYPSLCDELTFALSAHVEQRIPAAVRRANKEKVSFTAAYLRNRLDEIGGRASAVGDNSGYSREQIYYIVNGKRPLTARAAVAFSETYPDIPVSELIAVTALANYWKAVEDA